MPTITMPVDVFIPTPAIANQMVRMFRNNSPTQLKDVQVVVDPTGSGVTSGTITGGTKANVVTTPAKHSSLVTNLNSGKVVITLTTDNSIPPKVIDFNSALVLAAAAPAPLALADDVPDLPPGDFLGEGSSSDSAIPV